MHPEFESFLNMTWNVTGTQVRDELEVSYSILPLAYHQHVWPVTKLLPYILDTCDYGPGRCIFMDYLEYCFTHQDEVIANYATSMDAFILSWSSQIANEYGYNVQDLLKLFDDEEDTHNSEMRTRYMFKWRTFSHQSGTPFAYVNGVRLEQIPAKAQDWMDMLQAVYGS